MDYIVIITAVTALIGAIATAIYQFRQANNQKKELEIQNRKLEQELDNQKRQLELQKRQQEEYLRIQSKDMTNRAVEAASAIIDDYREELKVLRDELQEVKTRYERELDELRKGREKDKHQILRLQWQVSQMTERIAALETEKEVLETQLDALCRENERLRNDSPNTEDNQSLT